MKNDMPPRGIACWCTYISNIIRRQSLQWRKEMRMTDFAVLFPYCSSSVPCKGKIWSGIMWFSEWNYELVKSYSLFLVSIIDDSTRKDTRSLNPINNSVNEQIVWHSLNLINKSVNVQILWHSLIYLYLYSRVKRRQIKRVNGLILQNRYRWSYKKNEAILRFYW
jgi:hypothetical protein